MEEVKVPTLTETEEVTETSPEELEEAKALFTDLKEYAGYKVSDDFEFDGTNEGLLKAREQTEDYWREWAQDELMTRIQDPMLKQIVAVGIKGQGVVNIQNYADLKSDIRTLESLDFKEVATAEDYLKYVLGGDDRYDKEYIDNYLTTLKDEGKIEEQAKKFQLKELADLKSQERIEEEKAKKAIRDKEDKQKQYREDFRKNLLLSKSSKEEQKAIESFFEPIKEMNLSRYAYTLNKIQENPAHFIQLLDILRKYNEKEGFKAPEIKDKENKKVITQLLSQRQKGGQPTRFKPNTGFRNPDDANTIVL